MSTGSRRGIIVLISCAAVAVACSEPSRRNEPTHVGPSHAQPRPHSGSSLETRQLPGFAIDLPPGAPASEVLDYRHGKYLMKNLGADALNSVLVDWKFAATDRSDLELASTGLQSMRAGGERRPTETLPGPRGTSVDSILILYPDGPLRMTAVPCGARSLNVVTFGAQLEALHRPIVASIDCQPDPQHETELVGVVPIVLVVPGWFAVERGRDSVMLSDGTSRLWLGHTVGSSSAEQVVPALFEALGATIATSRRDGDRHLVTGTADGEAFDGWGVDSRAARPRCGSWPWHRTSPRLLGSPS